MSSILIKSATIIYPGHELHNTKRDLLIKNGVVEKIGTRIVSKVAKVISSKKLHLSPGWLDIGCTGGEPGHEHRETLESLSRVAAAGGYTGLALFPNTEPVIDNRSAVQYIKNQTKAHLVDYYPIAAVSKSCEGQELTEMIDLHQHGAIAFSDGHKPISSNGLMMRALDYSKGFGGLIIHHPHDPSLTNGHQVNEGEVSLVLGMKGTPAIAEVLTLDRDLQLNNYSKARLLIHNVSTAESVDKLQEDNWKNSFASVSYLHLCKTDQDLYGYDTNYKMIPTLGSAADKAALITAVNKRTIQVISSNHVPLEEDLKKREYFHAEPGTLGLQTTFSALNTYTPEINLGRLVTCLSINPRKILGLPPISLDKGHKAEFTLFDPTVDWTLDTKTNASKSKNSPFWDKSLTGCVIAVVNGKKSHFNKY